MGLELIPPFIRENYECHEWKHACAILVQDFPDEWKDICDVLTAFRLKKSWITVGGKNRSKIAIYIDGFLHDRGWNKKEFATTIKVDNVEHVSPTHEVDCFKNRIALEVEWSNKDPFYDRDLNNFRLLFDLRTISVGVIITRASELQQIFNSIGRGKSYGNSTTHMGKLLPRVVGGGGAGCPLLVFGITKKLYVEDTDVEVASEEIEESEDED